MPGQGIAGMNHIGLDENHGPRPYLVWSARMVECRAPAVHDAYGIFSVRVSSIAVMRIYADAQFSPGNCRVAVDVVVAAGRHRFVKIIAAY